MTNRTAEAGRVGGPQGPRIDTEPGTTQGAGEAIPELVSRLRATASRLVPYSDVRTQLRAAAAVIEQLDRETRSRGAEIVRLTLELKAGLARS